MDLGSGIDRIMQKKTWIVPATYFLKDLHHACSKATSECTVGGQVDSTQVADLLVALTSSLLDVKSGVVEFKVAEEQLLERVHGILPWFDPALDNDFLLQFYDTVLYALQVDLEKLLSQLLRVDLWSTWSVVVSDGDLYLHYVGDQRIIEWQLQQRQLQDRSETATVAEASWGRASVERNLSIYGSNHTLEAYKREVTERQSSFTLAAALRGQERIKYLTVSMLSTEKVLQIELYDTEDCWDLVKVVSDGGVTIELIEDVGMFRIELDGDVAFTYRAQPVGLLKKQYVGFETVSTRDDYKFVELSRRLKKMLLS